MSPRQLSVSIALLAFSSVAQAEMVFSEGPRSTTLEFKLGGYKPNRGSSLTAITYDATFGGSAMLLFELELDRIVWQKFGTLGLGFSAGYAEKYARARIVSTGEVANESTALKVVPLRVLGVYRLDYGALKLGVPLVPYGKVGFVFTPWWAPKGGNIERVEGSSGSGAKYGYCFTGGLSLMLDFLEPRLAKDFSSDLGVHHSYLFAEYIYENVNNFGRAGVDLSSRHWMFGFAMDF